MHIFEKRTRAKRERLVLISLSLKKRTTRKAEKKGKASQTKKNDSRRPTQALSLSSGNGAASGLFRGLKMAEKKSLFPIFTQAAKRVKKADEEDGGGGGAATQQHQTQPTPAAAATTTTTGNAASSKKRRNSSSTPASAPRSQVRDAFFLPLACESSVSRFEAEPE